MTHGKQHALHLEVNIANYLDSPPKTPELTTRDSPHLKKVGCSVFVQWLREEEEAGAQTAGAAAVSSKLDFRELRYLQGIASSGVLSALESPSVGASPCFLVVAWL